MGTKTLAVRAKLYFVLSTILSFHCIPIHPFNKAVGIQQRNAYGTQNSEAPGFLFWIILSVLHLETNSSLSQKEVQSGIWTEKHKEGKHTTHARSYLQTQKGFPEHG